MTSKSSKLIQSLLGMGDRQQRTAWQPAMDIYRCDKGWLIKIDLAGVKDEDIQLGIHANRLTIRGTRRDLLIQQGHQSYSMEIAYNRFERTVELPINIEDTKIHTEYQDGMLHIHLEQEQKQ